MQCICIVDSIWIYMLERNDNHFINIVVVVSIAFSRSAVDIILASTMFETCCDYLIRHVGSKVLNASTVLSFVRSITN